MNFRDAMNVVEYEVVEEEIKHDEVVDFLKKRKLLDKPCLLNVEGKRVATNFVSSRELVAKYLGVKKEELVKVLAKVESGDVSVREMNYDELRDLNDLPIIKYFEGDGGRYITAGVVIACKDPENFSTYNASIHRLMVVDEKKLAARLVPPRHTYLLWRDAVEKGEELEIAVCIGVHPLFMLASSTRLPEGKEFYYAAGLMGGLEVSDVDGIYCPESEVIIRGRITAETVKEGPFVDITGTYDLVRDEPVVEVDKIYAKEDFIYYSITPASKEHQILMGLPAEPEIYKAVSKVCRVKNVVLTPGGRHWLHAVVQIEKRTEGDGKNAILAAFAAHPSLKHVVVVDDDIDVYNYEDIEFAIATRFQADRDLVVVSGARGSSLDPSAKDNITAKMGIDATMKGDRTKFKRVL
ncbi:UbiD family decarboxylase [Ferroglobus placidus DSM 10642]|uniref:Anhydromevalonate phosphate decarboxylase n=1 Tax=Ferroglobus placidus (strain DSM 10642 / AEDII12DO) TaxID=589924 RepID=D3RYY1_FERPA|nr:UbiD family decarboxylase [Ferroglobus placidus]ADC65694.1 UbiD family decarboxylase [Ferroglobus placidus DSM 10642]